MPIQLAHQAQHGLVQAGGDWDRIAFGLVPNLQKYLEQKWPQSGGPVFGFCSWSWFGLFSLALFWMLTSTPWGRRHRGGIAEFYFQKKGTANCHGRQWPRIFLSLQEVPILASYHKYGLLGHLKRFDVTFHPIPQLCLLRSKLQYLSEHPKSLEKDIKSHSPKQKIEKIEKNLRFKHLFLGTWDLSQDFPLRPLRLTRLRQVQFGYVDHEGVLVPVEDGPLELGTEPREMKAETDGAKKGTKRRKKLLKRLRKALKGLKNKKSPAKAQPTLCRRCWGSVAGFLVISQSIGEPCRETSWTLPNRRRT